MELLAPDYAPNWGRRDAAWSPDGSRIAVVALWRELSHWYGPTGTVSVFTVAADGSDPQTVAGRGYGRRLLARHARQPYNPADLRICRGNASVNASLNPGLVNDCAALLALHEDLPDAVELNWTRERPLREWDGVTIGGSPPRIRELRLTGVRLDRRAARSLIWLTDLRVLDLSRSEVGSIWSELGELRNLEELRLAGTDAQGGIPAELGQLTNLRVLDLSFNELSESIPSEVGQLAKLRVLDLSWNRLKKPNPGGVGAIDQPAGSGSVTKRLDEVDSGGVGAIGRADASGPVTKRAGWRGPGGAGAAHEPDVPGFVEQPVDGGDPSGAGAIGCASRGAPGVEPVDRVPAVHIAGGAPGAAEAAGLRGGGMRRARQLRELQPGRTRLPWLGVRGG